jgi:MFS transporter, AAHS family, 4-hydroxybenzoate transporter
LLTQSSAMTLQLFRYPTDCRATGVGFSAGIGRLGPIVGAFAGGVLLDQQGGIY